MSGKLIIMGVLAVGFGATSYVAGNHYLESQTQARLNELESNRTEQQNIELSKIVVATEELRFGQTIEPEMLKLVDWPEDSQPEGGFSSIDDVIAKGDRRAIQTILPGEPVLAAKVTGENSRAGLAGIISDGMRAVTIPVNMVNGVGGFVQPGDRVDLVLTSEDNESEETVAKIIMENVKVLSVDQDAGSRSSTAKVAQSVTLETDTQGAQKIALANNVGSISLLLRSVGDASAANAGTVNSDNLNGSNKGFLSFLQSEATTTSVRVVYGDESKNVTVRIEKQKKDNNNNN